jgi:hypothetical protein
MQVNSQVDSAALIERLVAEASPRRGALDSWRAFLQAHATLMRRLAAELAQATGLSLGDFDVLAQLAGAVVALTEAGLARLADTAPVHLRGVVELFVSQLTDEELALLKSALDKVTVECTFGS